MKNHGLDIVRSAARRRLAGARETQRPVLALCAALSVLAAVAQAQQPPDGPVNVLIIMSDQHNAHALGCYDNGFGGVPTSLTPNLDKLANEGVRFTSAIVAAPRCQPSRYSVLTGRWVHNHGLKWNGIWEPRTFETFPALLRRAGYATLSAGKDHLIITDQPEPIDDFGFDLLLKKGDYNNYCFNAGVPLYNQNGNFWSMPNMPGTLASAGYTFNSNEFTRTSYFADQTIEFLEARAADGTPFACWVQEHDPHAPVLPTGPADARDWAHMYHPWGALDLPPNFNKVPSTQLLAELQNTYSSLSDDDWRQVLSYYYGFISQMDYNIGRILERLEDLGLADNTLVIYTADHGEFSAEMRSWTKGKFHYDSINRVPLIMRLPGVLPAGRVIDSLVSNVDYFPTMADLTGIPISDERRAQVDGESLVDLMLASAEPLGWRQEIFSELGTAELGKTRMVRTRDAKYIYDDLYDEEELYDLTVDPWEIDNLVDDPAYATLLADLRGSMDTWWNDEIGHHPDYLRSRSNEAPKEASHPAPATLETGVARDVNLEWRPNPAAETLELYMGIDPLALALKAELTHMESFFNVGTLAPGQSYYWRIDSINQNGTTTGTDWVFTTEAGGAGGPRLAEILAPAHRAQDVDVLQALSWAPALDATSQELHLGLAGQMVLVATLAASQSSFQPSQLLAGRTYHWRVDEISAAGTTEGSVWIFSTSAVGLPERATVISPRHLDHAVTQDRHSLEWSAGAGADYHDMYFGSTFPLAYQGRLTNVTSFDPGTLQSGTPYYWRIDEGNRLGTVIGSTWRFRAAGDELGTVYCSPAVPNSTGDGGRMHVVGSDAVGDDDLTLVATHMAKNKFGYFLTSQTQGFIPNPAGSQGNLCLSGQIGRFAKAIQFSGPSGTFSTFVDLSNMPGGQSSVLAGETWNFQCWFRDKVAGQSTSNFTDGIEIVFN